jgi:hypothetical protein
MTLLMSLRSARGYIQSGMTRSHRCRISTSHLPIRTGMYSNSNHSWRLWSSSTESDISQLQAQIQSKGDEIRQMKANGADKDALAPHIAELKALKAQLPSESTSSSPPKTSSKQQSPPPPPPPPLPATVVAELSDSELRQNRWAKVESMRDAGVDPFAYSFAATHSAVQLADLYDDQLENGEEDTSANVAVAGRILTRRVFGKLAFFTLQDGSGSIQLQFDRSRLGDAFHVRISCCRSVYPSILLWTTHALI